MKENPPRMSYLLRVYGQPAGTDEEHDSEQAAIASGRAQLRGRTRPAFAEVKRKLGSNLVWSGYIDSNGEIAETYDREPGSD